MPGRVDGCVCRGVCACACVCAGRGLKIRAWERQIELYREKVAESGAAAEPAATATAAAAAEEEEEEECALCFMAYEDCVVTPCNHRFCRDCVSPWVAEHETCPMCATHTPGLKPGPGI